MGYASRGWRSADSALESDLASRCWRRGRELQVPTQILALAAQMVLCAAPLLVATSAVVRRAGGHGLGEPLARYLGLHGPAARDFMLLFAGSRRVSMTEPTSGLIVGAAFGTGIAATQQRGFETLWSLPRAPVFQEPPLAGVQAHRRRRLSGCCAQCRPARSSHRLAPTPWRTCAAGRPAVGVAALLLLEPAPAAHRPRRLAPALARSGSHVASERPSSYWRQVSSYPARSPSRSMTMAR